MLNKLLKNKKIFFVVGSMGIGKTTFANKLSKLLIDKTEIIDNYMYGLTSDREAMRYLFKLKSGFAGIRHTNNNFIICTHRYPNKLDREITSRFYREKIAWIFLSIDKWDFYDYPITVPKKLVHKFNIKLKNSLTQKRKTRPYLIVTKEGFKLGRYKK